jgi:hypothetical protein
MSKDEQCRVVKYLVRKHFWALHLVGKSCGEVRIQHLPHTAGFSLLVRDPHAIFVDGWSDVILAPWDSGCLAAREPADRQGLVPLEVLGDKALVDALVRFDTVDCICANETQHEATR